MMTNIVELKAVQIVKQTAALLQGLSSETTDLIEQLSTVNLALLSPELIPKAVETMMQYKLLHQSIQPEIRDHLNQKRIKLGKILTLEEVAETIKTHNPNALRVCMI